MLFEILNVFLFYSFQSMLTFLKYYSVYTLFSHWPNHSFDLLT